MLNDSTTRCPPPSTPPAPIQHRQNRCYGCRCIATAQESVILCIGCDPQHHLCPDTAIRYLVHTTQRVFRHVW